MSADNTIIRDAFVRLQEQSINYVVGIIGLSVKYPQHPPLLGSGTLVSLGNSYAILTAHHVANEIKQYNTIGLNLSTNTHNFHYGVQELNIIEIARGTEEAKGPDLALVILPSSKIGQIKAYLSFYDLSYWLDLIVEYPPTISDNSWILCGYIDETSKQVEPEFEFDLVKDFEIRCNLGIVTNYKSYADFDYCDFEVIYDDPDRGLPFSFGGTSGGSLWYIPFEKDNTKNITTYYEGLILAGVAFFQTEIDSGYRYIRCHGWDSILKSVVPLLSSGEQKQ